MKKLQISERLRWQGINATTTQIKNAAMTLGFGDKRDYSHDEAMAVIRHFTQENAETKDQQPPQASYDEAKGALVPIQLEERQQLAIARGQNAAIAQLQNLVTSENALSLKAYNATIQAGIQAMDAHLDAFWGQIPPTALDVEAIEVVPTTTTFDCLAYGAVAGQLAGTQ